MISENIALVTFPKKAEKCKGNTMKKLWFLTRISLIQGSLDISEHLHKHIVGKLKERKGILQEVHSYPQTTDCCNSPTSHPCTMTSEQNWDIPIPQVRSPRPWRLTDAVMENYLLDTGKKCFFNLKKEVIKISFLAGCGGERL